MKFINKQGHTPRLCSYVGYEVQQKISKVGCVAASVRRLRATKDPYHMASGLRVKGGGGRVSRFRLRASSLNTWQIPFCLEFWSCEAFGI